jgi:CrcB protein
VTALLVALSGATGAGLRYLFGGALQRRAAPDLPVGTAAVNLSGAFALGVVVGSGLTGNPLVALSGLLAGFTTYSTWMVETVALLAEGSEGRWRAGIDLFGLATIGLAVAWIGLEVGRMLA